MTVTDCSFLFPKIWQLLSKCDGGQQASQFGPLGYSWSRGLRQAPPTVLPPDGRHIQLEDAECCFVLGCKGQKSVTVTSSAPTPKPKNDLPFSK